MISSEVLDRWSDYEQLMSREELLAVVEEPLKLAREAVTEILPGISVGASGLQVSSVFLRTQTYWIEVGLARGEFDFIRAGSEYFDYRFKFGEAEVASPSGEMTRYQTAVVHIQYKAGMVNLLSYVGDQREKWLTSVLSAFPLGDLARIE